MIVTIQYIKFTIDYIFLKVFVERRQELTSQINENTRGIKEQIHKREMEWRSYRTCTYRNFFLIKISDHFFLLLSSISRLVCLSEKQMAKMDFLCVFQCIKSSSLLDTYIGKIAIVQTEYKKCTIEIDYYQLG